MPPFSSGVLGYKINLRVVTNQAKVAGQENNSHTCWLLAKKSDPGKYELLNTYLCFCRQSGSSILRAVLSLYRVSELQVLSVENTVNLEVGVHENGIIEMRGLLSKALMSLIPG